MADAPCVFCDIVAKRARATIVAEDAGAIAFLDLRQFHAGHVLVVPREHVADLRNASDSTVEAVFRLVARVARAVDRAFPADGLSVWHSAGHGANQEVPHLHVHVHPRYLNDGVLRVYPAAPSTPTREQLDHWGVQLREALAGE